MKRLKVSDILILLLATGAVAAASLYAKAQQGEGDGESRGRVVDLAPGADDLSAADQEDNNGATPRRPIYWIGVNVRPVVSDTLRTHLQLAGDLGLVVESVVPDSPADRAGLRKHDVLIAIDGEPATAAAILQDAVLNGDAKAVELDVIRLAKETRLAVTPEQMPEELGRRRARQSPLPFGGRDFGGLRNFEGFPGIERGLLDQLEQRLPDALGNLGIGQTLEGRAAGLLDVPGGVSIRVSRRDGEPAQIQVKRGDQEWTIDGGDEDGLADLPEDLRPLVESLIDPGQRPRFGRDALEGFELQDQLRELLPHGSATEERSELLERMEQMERRMEELQEQLQQR